MVLSSVTEASTVLVATLATRRFAIICAALVAILSRRPARRAAAAEVLRLLLPTRGTSR
jgi:hypothetical protein